jgi:hypothetical protein
MDLAIGVRRPVLHAGIGCMTSQREHVQYHNG